MSLLKFICFGLLFANVVDAVSLFDAAGDWLQNAGKTVSNFFDNLFTLRADPTLDTATPDSAELETIKLYAQDLLRERRDYISEGELLQNLGMKMFNISLNMERRFGAEKMAGRYSPELDRYIDAELSLRTTATDVVAFGRRALRSNNQIAQFMRSAQVDIEGAVQNIFQDIERHIESMKTTVEGTVRKMSHLSSSTYDWDPELREVDEALSQIDDLVLEVVTRLHTAKDHSIAIFRKVGSVGGNITQVMDDAAKGVATTASVSG